MIKKTIAALLATLILTCPAWADTESIKRNIDKIADLEIRQNVLNENQVKLNNKLIGLVREMDAKDKIINDLIAQLRVALEKAALAEEVAKSLRSDTFNLKASIVQLEGELNEIRNEQEKPFWKR